MELKINMLRTSLSIQLLLALMLGRFVWAISSLYPPEVTAFSEAVRKEQQEAAENLTIELQNAIKAGATVFKIPGGEYRFSGSKVPGLLISAKDFQIDATGARFWFNGQIRQDGIVFKNCQNVSLRGLTIDYDPYSRTAQGRIVTIDRDAKRLLVKLEEGYPKPDASWFELPGRVKAIFFSPEGFLRPVTLDWLTKTAPAENGTIECGFRFNRVFASTSEVRAGDQIAMPDRSMRMAVVLTNCEKVTLEDLTIYAAPQMALTEQGGAGGNIFRNCRVVRQPGTSRLLSCNADVFHSASTKNGPLIEHCEFANSGDDLINIHSFFSLVWETGAAGRAVVALPTSESPKQGQLIAFYRSLDLTPLGRPEITSAIEQPALAEQWKQHPDFLRKVNVGQLPGGTWRAWEINYHPSIPTEQFDLLTFMDRASAGANVRDNYFHDTPGRGILLKCREGIVANNRIERTAMPGIMLATDSFSLEGPFPAGIKVQGNHLSNVAFSPLCRTVFNGNQAAITAWADNGRRRFAAQGNLLTNIAITDNIIERTSGAAIFLANTSGGSVRGNQIKENNILPLMPNASDQMTSNRAAIQIDYSENIDVQENTINSGAGNLLYLGGNFKKQP